jgi:gluconate 5-dehydrogenase
MSSLFSLSGKTALITGSTRGLGLAYAQGLAAAGATVILNGTQESHMQTALATLKE